MNPYQVMGIIAGCTLIFAGVVTFLTMQGVPILLAFLGVYLVAIWCMLGMQRRARQTFDGMEHIDQRRRNREAANQSRGDEPVSTEESFSRGQASFRV